jgi:hypothetical protein
MKGEDQEVGAWHGDKRALVGGYSGSPVQSLRFYCYFQLHSLLFYGVSVSFPGTSSNEYISISSFELVPT